jgi:hypothetical protein
MYWLFLLVFPNLLFLPDGIHQDYGQSMVYCLKRIWIVL